MSYLRIQTDLAIKEPIPQLLKDKLPAIRDAIRELKSYASIINKDADNEEMTIRAVWHICNHDIGEICTPEQEI